MQVKPEYEIIEDFEEVAIKLINKFPELFPNVDAQEFVKNIKCVGITNKERKDDATIYELKGVTSPVRMFCECAYVAIVYTKDWTEMDQKHRAALVQQVLLRIPIDQELEGKIMPLDFKDISSMIRTLGPDYMERDDIPDLLNEDVKWIVR